MIRTLRRATRTLRAQLRDSLLLLRQFWWPLFSLFVITSGVAVLFYTYYREPGVEPLTFWEALYFVVTLTVIESAFAPPHTNNQWLIVFFFIMPFVGLVLAGQGLVNFVTLLFNRQARGQAWKIALASTMSKHIVVCGGGRVGSLVVANLTRTGLDNIVVIERDMNQPTVQGLIAQGIVVLEGNIRDLETLRQANVPVAQTVIIATDDDLANLESGLHCRELNPDVRVVMRIFDAELARRVRASFDIEAAYSSSALAAPIFAGAALGIDVQRSFEVDGELMASARLVVPAASPLSGRQIGDVEVQFDVSLIYHRRGDSRDLHPPREVELQAGDVLVALATLPALNKLAHAIDAVDDDQAGHVVVCGGGRVGSLIVQTLRDSGVSKIVVIERNLDRPTVRKLREQGVPLIPGDMRDYDILRRANIARAATVIVASDDDLANLEAALHCRELNPDVRVVLRMFDAELARRVRQTFGIEAAFSSSALAAPIIAGAALEVDVQRGFDIDGERVSAARIEIGRGSGLDGMTIADAEVRFKASIIFHKRGPEADLHPLVDIQLQAYDTIIAMADFKSLQKMARWSRARR